MGLRSGLAIKLAVQTPNVGVITTDVTRAVDNLRFSTVSPGGFGTLTARLRFKGSRIPRPNLSAFAFVVVSAGPQVVWLGELMTPAIGLSQRDGEYVTLNALGIGNGLRDNAGNWSYTNSTAQAIARAQLTQHTATQNDLSSVLSTDNSQLFPDNPTASISQVYVARTMEEIIADVAFLAGDYAWGVEADPLLTSATGMPLGRLWARQRDLTTANYVAYTATGDFLALEMSPNADRCYNSIEIDYINGTSGLGTVVATDSRLASDLSQGTAPFRYRRYARDLSSLTTVTAAMASSIANTYLNLFKNITYTGKGTLVRARDGVGAPLPLYLVSAAHNLAIPETGVQGAQLPTAYTQGVNLFWITQATYTEDATGKQSVDVDLGYLPDNAGVQIAQLQMAADARARSGSTTATIQSPGAPMRGYYGWTFSNGVAGQTTGATVEFPAMAAHVPTSLSFSSLAAVNTNTLSANLFTSVGANVYATVTASGQGGSQGTYTTNGNCLRHVDREGRRFAHHCDACDRLHTDRALDEHLVVGRWLGQEAAGLSSLSVVCPACGAVEAYNTALSEREETHPFQQRAEQVRLIREAMRAHALPLL